MKEFYMLKNQFHLYTILMKYLYEKGLFITMDCFYDCQFIMNGLENVIYKMLIFL